MSENLKVLFQEVVELPAEQREIFYAQRHVSEATRAELESLLTFDETPIDALSEVVGSAAEEFLRFKAPVTQDGMCGPYRLVQLLGNGGMGAVYLAERADGEVEQQVAIKFLRAGSDLPSFRARFLKERQILASLNHAGIARLLDAGHSSGQPYLVMEYVDGIRIDQYVAGQETAEILELFLRVCDAVSYAHRNLIIHRDLKPSNVLVDAAGQPKLLDFGIAKILDAPEETRTLDRLLTPEYSSPEQLRGEAQATSTDIYSLGAVLSKLLTGQRLPTDLQFILGKAKRKEPEERYATVDAFADDVRAYLEHRPVRARTRNAWYVARMFVRRYWVPVGAAALAVAGLGGGFVLARQERTVAQARFDQVRQLSNKLFELDAQVRDVPGTTQVRHSIISASLEYLDRLGSEVRLSRWRVPSQSDTDLTLEIAKAYMDVAHVQGVPGHPNLGQFAQAKESLSKADTFIESVLPIAAAPGRRKALRLSAGVAHDGMILADGENRPADGVALAQRAADRLAAFLEMGPPDSQEATIAAGIYSNIALFYSNNHRGDDAAHYARKSLEVARNFSHDEAILSAGLGVFANAARFAGDLDGALAAIREARAIAEKAAQANDSRYTLAYAAALWREGLILGELNNINLDRPQEAASLITKAFDLSEEMARRDARDYTGRSYVSMTGRELGDILRDSDPARALAVYDLARQRLQEIKNNTKARRDEVWVLAGASYALRRLHSPNESKERIDAALAILQDLKDYPSEKVALGSEADAAVRALADHYAETGQTSQAIATYETLLAKVRASDPKPDTDLRHANGLSRIYHDLAALHRRAGDVPQASMLEQQRLDLWRYWDQKLPNNPFVRRQLR
jgi:serine/threonine protein kinase/tetratricopeptide (TPR) repeat protein